MIINQTSTKSRWQQQAVRGLALFEILFAGLALLAGVLSARVLPYAMSGLLLLWPLRWLLTGRLTLRTPLDLPLALIVLMGLVSWQITALPAKTQPQVLSLFLGIAAFYALVNGLRTAVHLRWLYAALIGLPLLLAIVGVLGVSMDNEGIKKLPFIPATIYSVLPAVLADSINTNVLAGSLAFVLPFAVCRVLFAQRRGDGWLRLGAALVVGVGVVVGVLTQSRNAILGLALLLVLAFLLRWPRRWYLLLLPLLVAAALWWFFRDHPQMFFYWLVLRGGVLSTLDGRMEIWMRALFMIQDFAFTGIGMGSFAELADALYPFSLEPRGIPHAHNLFLQIAVDLGTPGLIAWLAAWLSMIILAWQTYRAAPPYRGLGAALLISQVVLGFVGIVDSVTWGGIKTANLVWLVWGVGVAAWRLSRPEPAMADRVEALAADAPLGSEPVEDR